MTSSPRSSSALAVLEQQLTPLAPRFQAALSGMMSAERLIRTVLVSVEKLPALLDCDRQSILMAAMSAACLGLEVDGVTGQAFLIPFKNRAQLVIGYKGLTTLAARAGLTISGDVVREGDAFEFQKGTGAFVHHRPRLEGAGRIIAAWATAEHRDRPPVVEVMGLEDIMAVKAKSPGGRRADSPWNDPSVGFPAMAAKTVKRRLWRSLPLSTGTAPYHMAARMDEATDEQGKAAWITPDRGLEIEGETAAIGPYEDSPTPPATQLIGASDQAIADYEQHVVAMMQHPDETAESLAAWWNSEAQKTERRQLGRSERMTALIDRVRLAIEDLRAQVTA